MIRSRSITFTIIRDALLGALTGLGVATLYSMALIAFFTRA
jgi:hypothetical protein